MEGKRNIKCFIFEDELNGFIKAHGDQYVKESNSRNKPLVYAEDFVLKDTHVKIIEEKNRVIDVLEYQNRRILPLLDRSDKEKSDLVKEHHDKLKEVSSVAFEALKIASTFSKKDGENLVKRLMQIL